MPAPPINAGAGIARATMIAARPASCTRARRAGGEAGVGLIEILVSVVILSIGFLAAARMQVEGMRYSQNAYFQSQAYFLATDMIDRMRSNVQGVIDGHYDDLATTSEASDPGCATNFCTDAELAAQDQYDWSSRLHDLTDTENFVPALPSSSATAAQGTVTALGGGIYAVNLTWAEHVDGVESVGSLTVNFATEIPG